MLLTHVSISRLLPQISPFPSHASSVVCSAREISLQQLVLLCQHDHSLVAIGCGHLSYDALERGNRIHRYEWLPSCWYILMMRPWLQRCKICSAFYRYFCHRFTGFASENYQSICLVSFILCVTIFWQWRSMLICQIARAKGNCAH